jgi:hypothetical protein
VAKVDPADDGALRYIVRHYRYDPARHERRHVDVAAFDNKREYRACMAEVQEEIERRGRDGERVDPRERVSGVVQEPGYLRRAANGRLLGRAIAHGVAPRWLDELELPGNVSFARAERED